MQLRFSLLISFFLLPSSKTTTKGLQLAEVTHVHVVAGNTGPTRVGNVLVLNKLCSLYLRQ